MAFRLAVRWGAVFFVAVMGLSLGHGPRAIANVPAELPPLQSWDFDPQQQQLRLQTSAVAVPQYSRLSDPPRLIIDLTNTTWPTATLTQTYTGPIQQLRIGQFTDSTTRIVLTWAETLPSAWSPAFRRIPQADGSVIWAFEFQGAIASTPAQNTPFVVTFPPALLPPAIAVPIQVPAPPARP